MSLKSCSWMMLYKLCFFINQLCFFFYCFQCNFSQTSYPAFLREKPFMNFAIVRTSGHTWRLHSSWWRMSSFSKGLLMTNLWFFSLIYSDIVIFKEIVCNNQTTCSCFIHIKLLVEKGFSYIKYRKFIILHAFV